MQSARTRRMVLWLPMVLSLCIACGSGTPRTAGQITATAPAPARVARAPSSPAQPIDPAKFTAGACVALPPTVAPRHLTVFLDAGHGGRDPGAVGRTESGRTIYEADQTLPVELDAAAILRRAGFQVVISRTGDTSVLHLRPDDVRGAGLTVEGSHEDVLARDVCANDAHANLLVGIYFDGGPPADAGALTAYDAVRPFAAENLRLANLVQDDVLAEMNAQGWAIPDAGVRPDAGLGSTVSSLAHAYGHLSLLGPVYPGWVSTPSAMPGALIEPLFITNPFEGSIAASPRGQGVIAEGLAESVEHYFGASD